MISICCLLLLAIDLGAHAQVMFMPSAGPQASSSIPAVAGAPGPSLAEAAVAPGPSAEAPVGIAGNCVARAARLVSNCNAFVSNFQNADPTYLGTATDAQVQAVVGQYPPPDATCCNTVLDFVEGECRCDPTVQTLTSTQGLTASSLAGVNRAGLVACSLPIDTDIAAC